MTDDYWVGYVKCLFFSVLCWYNIELRLRLQPNSLTCITCVVILCEYCRTVAADIISVTHWSSDGSLLILINDKSCDTMVACPPNKLWRSLFSKIKTMLRSGLQCLVVVVVVRLLLTTVYKTREVRGDSSWARREISLILTKRKFWGNLKKLFIKMVINIFVG